MVRANTDSDFSEPVVVKCPFSVIVDTREQSPFLFNTIKANVLGSKTKQNSSTVPARDTALYVPVVRKGLATGDYSLPDYEQKISVERKSKADFFYCVGADRERFEEQVKRLSTSEVAAVVVECGWESILSGYSQSKLSPKIVFRTVMSWQQRYPTVHWHFCFSRMFAERVTFEILRRFWFERHDKSTLRKRSR